MKKCIIAFLMLAFVIFYADPSEINTVKAPSGLFARFGDITNRIITCGSVSGMLRDTLNIQRFAGKPESLKVVGFRAMGITGAVLLALGFVTGIVAIGMTIYMLLTFAVGVGITAITLGLAGSGAFGGLGWLVYAAMALGITAGSLLIIGLPLCIVGFVLSAYFEKKVSMYMEVPENEPCLRTGFAVRL